MNVAVGSSPMNCQLWDAVSGSAAPSRHCLPDWPGSGKHAAQITTGGTPVSVSDMSGSSVTTSPGEPEAGVALSAMTLKWSTRDCGVSCGPQAVASSRAAAAMAARRSMSPVDFMEGS